MIMAVVGWVGEIHYLQLSSGSAMMLRASPSGLDAGEDRPSMVDGEKAAFVYFSFAKFLVSGSVVTWLIAWVAMAPFFPSMTPQCVNAVMVGCFPLLPLHAGMIAAQSRTRRPHRPSDCQGIVLGLGGFPYNASGLVTQTQAKEAGGVNKKPNTDPPHSMGKLPGRDSGAKGERTTSLEMAVRLSSTSPPASASRRKAGAFSPQTDTMTHSLSRLQHRRASHGKKNQVQRASPGHGLDRTGPLPWSFLPLAIRAPPEPHH
ncbi:hypothetical protein B0T18DRAFT_240524 [Schizothecium vesticola]|uniref:Uncharacterized protein n=1 Tax=Schizothecium vesticola TaxID=314040 RepID=A0AA40BPW9_9PEZI|nr:hypothetical protein B0T18DRAFT_240524 [Schizothecium vesticola]